MRDAGTIDCDGCGTIQAQGCVSPSGLCGGALLSVLPVMKSVERNEAAHLGPLNPT